MINDSINRFLGVLCYPFVSMEVFKKDLFQEYMIAVKEKDKEQAKKTREYLKDELVEYIQQNYTIYSYDEVYLYLEKCYLYDAGNYENALELYLYVMRKMASTLLSHRDGKIVFKYWRNKDDEAVFGGFAGNNKVALFHSLNCHIPMDVIAIIYMIINQKEPDAGCLNYFYGNIEVADQQLSRFLEKGVAENHLHKGVSRTFSSIWDSLMAPLTAENYKYFQNRKFVKGTKEQNNRVLFYILGCGIVRICLSLEISHKKTFHFFEDEEERNTVEKSTDEESTDKKEIQNLLKCFCDGGKFEEYYKKFFSKENKNKEEEILSYYMRLWKRMEYFLPEDAFKKRICTLVLNEAEWIHTFDENIFLYHALYRMMNENVSWKIKQCIMQYLRVRNYLFHTSVQQKTIKGLDYFQQAHYSINSALNHVNIKDFWENAIREQLQNRDLQKIEFRSSMPDSYSAFKKEVLQFLKAYQKIIQEDYCYNDGTKYIPCRKITQVGLVIHFLKRPDESIPEKCLQNGKADCSYFQFGTLQNSYKKQIDAFVQLRSEFSELSRYLVGIDAASLENATPIWVFAPIYEKARDSSIEQIGKSSKNDCYTQSLGFTFHAGEDFRHILSGLRRIDEAVEYLKFHAGDRIGHGIALGLSARKWKNQNPVIIIPQMEALENYLWAYDTLSKNYSDFQATVLAYMEKRIFELSGNIFGNMGGITIETLISAYHGMFYINNNKSEFADDAKIIEKDFCKKLCSGEQIIWNSRLLGAARHCKKFVMEMERPIHYEITEQDLLIIEKLQKILKEKLGRKGIVVEVNPSSNTAIADLDVLEENQFYEMNMIYEKENVIVCINSDDPAVFNTNVSNELAYIYYGMLDQGISREAALHWIDRIRENGINSSFIHHQESDEMLMNNLSELINSM